ncbi:hypothetical protein AF71_00028620 [Rhizobium sp. 57MFTsu3.2]|nr:hypothetical protein [Rhizobium sp. 57MFTsu3.2]
MAVIAWSPPLEQCFYEAFQVIHNLLIKGGRHGNEVIAVAKPAFPSEGLLALDIMLGRCRAVAGTNVRINRM